MARFLFKMNKTKGKTVRNQGCGCNKGM